MVRSKDYAQTRLQRLDSRLWQVMIDAWVEYENSYRQVRGNHRPGTQATIIHDLIIKYARATFCGLPGVTVIEQPQTILVNVDDEWLIKFKLLRRGCLRSATNQTAFSGEFFSQLPVQLTLFDEPTHLVVGYVLNKTRSAMESVHVVCPRDTSRNAWDFEIAGIGGQAQAPSSLPARPRVTPKLDGAAAAEERTKGARDGNGAG